VTQITSIIHEGRHKLVRADAADALRRGGIGITGVTSELVQHGGNIEFLSIGSCVHQEGAQRETLSFSTSANGQELYCQMDAGSTRSSSCSATSRTRSAWAAASSGRCEACRAAR